MTLATARDMADTTPVPPEPPTPEPRYGGHRLDPRYYEPARVPPEVARHAGPLDTLPTGSPGKVGLLDLEFALTGRATELVGHYEKSPLQIMHPHYYDPARPDMPYTYLLSTGAGVMQGDRLRTDLTFGDGTSAHVTAAYTKVLRMEHDYAVAQTNIALGADAYVEYLPDPVIAFAEARFYQQTRVSLPSSATLVLGETFVAGRLARGEHHEYSALASDLDVCRPDGSVVALDRVRLTPIAGATGGLAVLDDRDVLSMLYVLTERAGAAEIGDLLHRVLSPFAADGLVLGVSTLPCDAGVWVRLLGDDTQTMVHALTTAWQAVRALLTDGSSPRIRKN
ncbi:urease accessory protein UreD [Nocardioides sp. cx-169]|uniref:urease accessory protein UreD n=1 Tax=Nocardioides sp. cx-169 TaxID=2899080 RepID=UPI001E5D942F|nr:urease accessory protein UreD [Nocardioides sp. cx-169]MCD4533627.1 urease accessory protein UreD [Nocardioides sp. cx-169]